MSSPPSIGRWAAAIAVARGYQITRAGAASFALFALAACGSTPPARAPAPPPCPAALVLQGAERTTAYRPGGQERADDIRYIAAITNLTSACRYGSGEAGADVDVDLNFAVIAERGPALSGPEQLTYFVATIGPDGQILAKQILQSDLSFAGGEERIGWSEALTLRLPSVSPEDGEDYALYVGFQLDEAELERRRQPVLRP